METGRTIGPARSDHRGESAAGGQPGHLFLLLTSENPLANAIPTSNQQSRLVKIPISRTDRIVPDFLENIPKLGRNSESRRTVEWRQVRLEDENSCRNRVDVVNDVSGMKGTKMKEGSRSCRLL